MTDRPPVQGATVTCKVCEGWGAYCDEHRPPVSGEPNTAGVLIEGSVFADDADLDHDAFLDAFLGWIESHGWGFGGTTRPVRSDEDYGEARATPSALTDTQRAGLAQQALLAGYPATPPALTAERLALAMAMWSDPDGDEREHERSAAFYLTSAQETLDILSRLTSKEERP